MTWWTWSFENFSLWRSDTFSSSVMQKPVKKKLKDFSMFWILLTAKLITSWLRIVQTKFIEKKWLDQQNEAIYQ